MTPHIDGHRVYITKRIFLAVTSHYVEGRRHSYLKNATGVLNAYTLTFEMLKHLYCLFALKIEFLLRRNNYLFRFHIDFFLVVLSYPGTLS